MKGYSAFPKAPALLEPHHQIVYCHGVFFNTFFVLIMCFWYNLSISRFSNRSFTLFALRKRCQMRAKSPHCYILTFGPSKMPFKVMHRKEVTHSNGSYERKSRGRKLADEMGRAKKFPWYTHRLMHRKRVTSELHDSYFRLMTIKHSISKIEWASNDYIIQVSSTSQLSCQ